MRRLNTRYCLSGLLCTMAYNGVAAPSLNDMTQHQSEVCKTQFSKFDFFKCYRQNRGNVGGQTIVKFNVVSEKNIFGFVSSRPVAARGISWKFLVKIQINSIKKYEKNWFFFIFKIVNKTDLSYSNMIIYPRRDLLNSLQNMSAVIRSVFSLLYRGVPRVGGGGWERVN